MRRTRITLGAIAGALLIAGCTTHYKVTDPASGKTYYTTKVHQNKAGSIEFKDAQTGNTVTVQNSEVAKIDKKEYNDAVKK